jgi:hypothetical protein
VPAFAHLLGIRPWELDRLTYQQWKSCKTYIDGLTGR